MMMVIAEINRVIVLEKTVDLGLIKFDKRVLRNIQRTKHLYDL